MEELKLFLKKLKSKELFETWGLENYFFKLKMVKWDLSRGSKGL